MKKVAWFFTIIWENKTHEIEISYNINKGNDWNRDEIENIIEKETKEWKTSWEFEY